MSPTLPPTPPAVPDGPLSPVAACCIRRVLAVYDRKAVSLDVAAYLVAGIVDCDRQHGGSAS